MWIENNEDNRYHSKEGMKNVSNTWHKVGKLNRICFEYTGSDVDAILDRLPTAKVENEKDSKYIIRAEVFGKGIDMWLRSQGENVGW